MFDAFCTYLIMFLRNITEFPWSFGFDNLQDRQLGQKKFCIIDYLKADQCGFDWNLTLQNITNLTVDGTICFFHFKMWKQLMVFS